MLTDFSCAHISAYVWCIVRAIDMPLVLTGSETGACDALVNPIALRKAKIVYNFGLFESNRVKPCLRKFKPVIKK